MRRTGFDPHEMVLLGTPPSQDDKPWAEFEKLATPLFDSLYNFARWLVRNQGDAEDLVQETYRKALLSFGSFQPSTNFRAWMFRILKNTFLSSCSRLERRMTVAMDSEQDGPERAVETETPETILIKRWCRAQSISCRRSTGRPSFFVRWRKCRTRKSPKYCRSP